MICSKIKKRFSKEEKTSVMNKLDLLKKSLNKVFIEFATYTAMIVHQPQN
jgi:hypothetical protein